MIRRAVFKDWKEIKRLNQMLFDYEADAFDNTLNTAWPDANDESYQNNASGDNFFALVHEEGGKIVGYLVARRFETKPYRNKIIQVELDHTFIEEEYRNKGIGRQMFEEMKKWALEIGATSLSVTASAMNADAIAFYHKCGFKDYNLTLEMEL